MASPERPITPWHKRKSGLFGDHFRQDATYTNWRPNGGGDWLLIYTNEGSGTLTTEKDSMRTSEGGVILYVPGQPQDYKTSPDAGLWDLLWVHFNPRATWSPWLQWPVNSAGLRYIHLPEGEIRESFVGAFRRMITLSRRDLPGAMDLAQNQLEECVLWAHIAASGDKRLAMDPRVRKAIDHLSSHFREPFDLETVARISGLSVSRLAHLFRDQTGMTVGQFVEAQRLQHAEQLLRISSLSVSQIADAAGYEDPFYFSNRFRRRTGKSPSEFRVTE